MVVIKAIILTLAFVVGWVIGRVIYDKFLRGK